MSELRSRQQLLQLAAAGQQARAATSVNWPGQLGWLTCLRRGCDFTNTSLFPLATGAVSTNTFTPFPARSAQYQQCSFRAASAAYHKTLASSASRPLKASVAPDHVTQPAPLSHVPNQASWTKRDGHISPIKCFRAALRIWRNVQRAALVISHHSAPPPARRRGPRNRG